MSFHRNIDPKLVDQFNLMSKEAYEIYLGPKILETFTTPKSIDFLRNHVSKNLPLVIRNALNETVATKKWSSNYMRKIIPEKRINVAITPNGYADGISKNSIDGKEYFVMPQEVNMTISDFLDALDDKRGPVYYIQRQNSNLIEDFEELVNDIDYSLLNFAREAFDKEPDAVNFWMGDSRAVTSMHKDPYENIYCVMSGFKDFILIPPVDVHLIPRETYPSAIYESDGDGNMYIKPLFDDNGKPIMIEWVSIDPLEPDIKKYPNYTKANIYRIRINAGDILYLPSLWYHHVQQSHKCIAVNYWYDMEYDSRYCFFKMMERMCGYKFEE